MTELLYDRTVLITKEHGNVSTALLMRDLDIRWSVAMSLIGKMLTESAIEPMDDQGKYKPVEAQ